MPRNATRNAAFLKPFFLLFFSSSSPPPSIATNALAGATMFAAMLVDKVATTNPKDATIFVVGLNKLDPRSATGSPTSITRLKVPSVINPAATEVTKTAITENNVMNTVNPTTCPLTCSCCVLENREKSEIFKHIVAQNPTTALRVGKK